MPPELLKLLKEPLVWVGALVLCVPMLASGPLKSIRNMLTFERQPVQVASALDEMEGAEVGLGGMDEIPDSIPEWKQPVTSLPPLPSSTEESDLLDNSIASLPATKPGISSSLDPGSLLPEVELYEEGGSTNSEDEEPEFDFLFGDDTELEEKEMPEKKMSEEMMSEEMSPEKASEEMMPEKMAEEVMPEKMAEEKMSQEKKLADDLSPEPQDESPNWLFPPDSEATADSGSDTKIQPPQLDGSDTKIQPPQLTDGDAMPGSILSPSNLDAPQQYPEPELVPVMPERAYVDESYPAPGQQPPPIQSDYFFEIQAGPDWWTPYCQQPFWGAIPTQQTGLDAVVFSALQNSPYVKLINTKPQMAQTVVTEADAQFDWSAFVEASWNDTDRAIVSFLDTGSAGGRFVQEQFLYESGVRKNLRSGGHLQIGNAWQRTDNNSIFLAPPDQATAQILLDYRQPLLRGAGKHVNNSQVVLASIGVEAAQSDTQVQIQQFLVDVVAEYWELHYARGVLVQRMRSAERAEQLYHEISARQDAQSWQRDLIRIQAVATARRTDLIRAQNKVAAHQEKLMNLTWGTAMPDPSSLEIVPMEAPGSYTVPYDLNFVTEMAVQNRPEVQVALAEIKASAVRQNLALNDLKPRLDAIVSTFISGVDEDKDVFGAFSDAKNFNPSYAVGFSFEVPLGRRAASSRVQRQQLDYQRLQHQLEQTLGNVRLDARLAYRDVQSLATELESHKVAVTQAAQELQVVTQNTATGLAAGSKNTSFMIDDLLQSQGRLADAEDRLLRSQTDLSVALVQMKRATGQLLQANPLPQVQDQFVQQATYEQPVYQQSPPQQPAYQQSPSQQSVSEQLWAAPNTSSVIDNDLWAGGQ